MTSILVQTQYGAPADLLERIERDRKTTFIDKMKWELVHDDGRERDDYDGPGAMLVTCGDPLIFSMRLLPETRCMLRDLWPEVAHYLRPGSHEMSRWISHGKHSLRSTRAGISDMMDAYRAMGWMDMFSVATDRVAKAHAVFGMNPQEQHQIAPDIHLCMWDLRPTPDSAGFFRSRRQV